MKIAYCSDAALPGKMANTVHIMKMSQAFARNGHNVVLIAHLNKKNYIDMDSIYRDYAVRPVFKIYMAKYPKVSGGGIIYTLNALRFIKRYKPDIVYGRSTYICSLAAILLKRDVIFEIHGETQQGTKMGRLFSKLIISKYLKRLVVISESLSQYYQKEWKIPKEKILVAHDGADIDLNNDEVKVPVIPTKQKNIGYFGSLFKGKGMELIVKIAENMRDYNFHIFGGKEDEIVHWKEKTKELSNIKFYGYVSQSLVKGYAKQMDVLLAPYLTKVYTSLWNETENIGKYMSPMKLFEYMSFEKPIVCTDMPVIREILQNGEDALLCDPNNVDDWTVAISLLCMNNEIAKKLSANAKKKLEDNYTWEIRARKVISLD